MHCRVKTMHKWLLLIGRVVVHMRSCTSQLTVYGSARGGHPPPPYNIIKALFCLEIAQRHAGDALHSCAERVFDHMHAPIPRIKGADELRRESAHVS